MWPNAPHRVLRSAVAAASTLETDLAGETAYAGRTLPIPRFAIVSPLRETTGHIEAMALYAGESVTNVTRVQPAAEIVVELVSGAEKLLHAAR
jgi:hypothetical protein